MNIPISSLQEGHYIDLEEIQDWLMLLPWDSTRFAIESEFAIVEGGEMETADCYRLDTSQGSYGLPPDLLVTVQGHVTDTYEGMLL